MSIGLLCFVMLATASVISCIICFVKEKKRETRIGIYLSSLGIVISLFGIIWTQYPNLFNKDVKELYKSWNIEDEKEIQSDKNIQDHKAWGPDREMIKWGSYFEHPAFNSIENNPYLGDERNFVRIRKANTDDKFSDEVDLEIGSEYEVAIYFHNNGDPSLNKSGNVIAENVRLKIEEPEHLYPDSYAVIKGILTSTNANPSEIWDVAYACADSEVLLRYVTNSAEIHSLGNIDGQLLSSDAMFGEKGVMIGYWNDLWGIVPAGKEFGGYVTYRFVVDQPNFSIESSAAIEGIYEYGDSVIVKPGDIIDFHLAYKNTGTITQESIIAYDELPDGLSYINGSSFYTSSFNREGNTVSDDLFSNNGIKLGDYKQDEWCELTYRVIVEDNENLFPKGDTVIYNNARMSTANGAGYDKVRITIHRD